MSRKRTIAEGRHFNLYTEWPLEDPVFLELEGVTFQAEKNRVTVEIPTGLWEFLRTIPSTSTDLAKLNDQALVARAKAVVDERISAWERLTPKERKERWFDRQRQEANKTRLEQVREQLELLFEDRDLQRALLRRMAAFKKEASREMYERRAQTEKRRWQKWRKKREQRDAKRKQKQAPRTASRKKIIERLLANQK